MAPHFKEKQTWTIGMILLNKYEIGDGQYSKILNNCDHFEANRIR